MYTVYHKPEHKTLTARKMRLFVVVAFVTVAAWNVAVTDGGK